MPEYDFTWVTDAPIKEIEPAEASKMAAVLKTCVGDWSKGYRDAKEPSERTPGVPTVAQIGSALAMCDTVAQLATQGQRACLYEICGVPIGILVWSEAADHDYIDLVVTHPAATGAGSILLEHVLTRAAKAGRSSVLRLEWQYETSKEAFIGLGFEVENELRRKMRLVAKDSAKWKQMPDRSWKYVSKGAPGTKYAATTKAA